ALGGDPLAALFAEELGAVVQLRADALDEARALFAAAGLADCVAVVGRPVAEPRVRIRHGERLVLDEAPRDLRDAWWQPSHRLQGLRDHPACAAEEHAPRLDDDDPGLHAALSFDPGEDIAAPFSGGGARPRGATLREQGGNSQAEMAAAFHHAGFETVD